MSLTLSNLSRDVEAALQKKADAEGKSVAEVAEQTLRTALGVAEERKPPLDLSEFIGTLGEDPELDAVLDSFRQVNPDTWK